MPTPSSSLATLRPDLQQSFEQFDLEMNQRGFIALKVCPVVEVPVASGNFGIIPIEQLLQLPDDKRAPGSGYSRGKWTFRPDTYATQEHGVEEPIDDNELQMYINYFSAEQIATRRAHNGVLLNMERRVASLLFDTSTWTGSSLTTAVSTPWSTVASATPISDVEAAVQKVYLNSGIWPNSLVISRKVFRNLRNCAQIVDRLKYSGLYNVDAKNLTAELLAQVFDLEQVIVANSAYNSAAEGQSASLASTWSDSYAMVGYIHGGEDFKAPTIARTFHWSADGSTIGGTVETYRDETVRASIVRCRLQTHEKVLYPQLGHLLSNIT